MFMVIAILQVKSLGTMNSVFVKKKKKKVEWAFTTNFSIPSAPNDSKMLLPLMYYVISHRPHS